MATALKPKVSISAKVKKQLEELAQTTGASETQLAEEAIASFVGYQNRVIAKVEEGRAAARRGEFVEQEDVEAWLDSWGSDDELPPPTVKA